MPLTRKQQVLFATQASESLAATLTGADAVLVFEPKLSDDADSQQRVPAGSSLSREVTPLGRKTRGLSYTSYFRGSGDTSVPIDAPDWGKQALSCGFEQVTPVAIPITAPSGTGFQFGEIVQKGSARGVVIGLLVSGATRARMAVAGTVVVVQVGTTAFTSSGTLTGESSGTTGTIGTVADYPGVAYKPTSLKLTRLVASGGWSGTAPVAGDVIFFVRSGVQVGSAQLQSISGTNHDVTELEGDVLNGDVMTFGAATATITSDPVQTKTPAATIGHNLDGRSRNLVAARGDFELAAASGEPFLFTWNWQGDSVPAVDELPKATSGLSSIRAPRLFASDGAIVAFGRTAYTLAPVSDTATPVKTLPTKSVSLTMGNVISPDLDANSSGGARGANVTDRDPTLSVVINQVLGGFDVEAFRDNAQTIHVAVSVGTVLGNIVGLVVPNGQIQSAPIDSADGVATHQLEVKPKRILEAGDDELYLFQL